MAAVAMSRSLNANLLRRWVVEAERAAEVAQGNLPPKALLPPPVDSQRFIPVAIERPAHSDARIRVEIRRSSTVVSVEWPPSAARECAEWLSGFLK
jgi:transposase